MQLACYLLASLLLHKYKVLINSLDAQDEDNLQFDRLMYLLLQSFNHESFNDSTKKDTEVNFSQSNMSDYNQWVLPRKQLKVLCYICDSPHNFKHHCLQYNDNVLYLVAKMIRIVSRNIINKELIREIQLLMLLILHYKLYFFYWH